MINKKYAAFLAAWTILLTGCKTDSAGSDATGTLIDIISATETSKAAAETQKSEKDKKSGKEEKLSAEKDDISEAFFALCREISSGEQIFPISAPDRADYYLSFYDEDGEIHYAERYTGSYDSYLEIDGFCYPADKRMDELAALNGKTVSVHQKSLSDGLFDVRYKCSEPMTNDEYINAARQCVYMWLDTLIGADDEQYRISSYSPNGREAVFGTFIAAGEISGAKEFSVNVLFNVEGTGEDSLFRQPSGSGYNTFYHYYNGPMVAVRCRWEDGICRIVDWDGAYMASLTDGLYGINTSESGYATFFDFMNDTAAVESYRKSVSPTEYRAVSHNPFMISDGKIFYVDIEMDWGEYVGDTPQKNGDGKVSAMFGDSFYSADRGVYSSPVRYNNDAREPYRLTLSENFDLVFDDYNSDGNPDYTIKYDEDEHGSYYMVECIANDGSPRAGGGEIYIAGRFEDSIRLQNTENGYVAWSAAEDGSLVPSRELDSYRMYSQRYYLPRGFREYSPEDGSVICYFWNNTGSSVSVGGKFTVERRKGDSWENIGSGTVPAAKCAPYRETAISFDLSGTDRGKGGEYRISLDVKGEKVYGGFYVRGDEKTILTVSENDGMLLAGATSLSFTVENAGGGYARASAAELLKDGKPFTEAVISPVPLLSPERSHSIDVSDENGFPAGTYTLKIVCGGKEFTGGKTVLADVSGKARSFFGGEAKVKKVTDGMDVTLTNGIYSKEDARPDTMYIECLTDKGWKQTSFAYGMDMYYTGSSGTKSVKYGEQAVFRFTDYMAEYMEELSADEESMEYLQKLYEEIKSDPDEYNLPEEMTFEEFIYEMYGISPEKPEKGTFCRIRVCGEYVYFTVE